MSGLDDLDTGNPAVRRALRDSYGWWVRHAGVDALRVDTAFYVPEELFADFLDSTDPRAPGLRAVARRTGRDDFLVFGEGFGIDRPFDDTQARKIERYMTVAEGPRAGTPLLPGMLNFPLYGALNEVFARGRPPAELAHRIAALPRLHARPHLMPTFLDNHDVDRFLAGGSTAALRRALVALFTLPGIPVIYYGTEQGFTRTRAAMFASGWGSGGRDHFDTAHPLYRHIAALAALRREHRLFSRGLPQVLAANAAGPGALAWRTADPDDPRRVALVAFNTGDGPALLDGMATGLAEGTVLRAALAEGATPAAGGPDEAPVVGAGGALTVVLPPGSARVWLATGQRAPLPAQGPAPTLEPPPGAAAGAVFESDFTLGGRLAAAGARLVVDGDLARAQPLAPLPGGRWQARVDTAAMIDPDVMHRAVVLGDDGQVSAPFAFRVAPRWVPAGEADDPAGDDRGPDAADGSPGRYRYPTDPSWGDNRQMDLRGLRAWTAGGALRLELQMHRVTRSWSPANGFDHVAFTVFVELPGEPGGATVMPQQNASLPEGMRWHRRLRVHGWSNALFDSAGASASAEGTPLAAAARIQTDTGRHTVQLTLPAAALGRRASLAGARIHVTTWDYDSGFRALGPEPGTHTMGGGAPDAPKVMDASAVITLR